MIDYEKLEKALQHLQRQYANLRTVASRPELTDTDREAIAESVVHRFETVYDTLWKTLKRYLSEVLGLPEIPNSPKPIFKLAAQNGLIDPVERWLAYADARVATAHDYSGSKAEAARALVHDFLSDANALLKKMSNPL
jgi:nucleotidyltransferase substrate binding protein (TIGR01987 family)